MNPLFSVTFESKAANASKGYGFSSLSLCFEFLALSFLSREKNGMIVIIIPISFQKEQPIQRFPMQSQLDTNAL